MPSRPTADPAALSLRRSAALTTSPRPSLRPSLAASSLRRSAQHLPHRHAIAATHVSRRLLESNPAGGRAVAVTNIRGKDAPALRLAFAKVGTIEAVELGEDERGAPTASIIFDEELGAIRAVEELNDEDNWRFGMRVRLESGMAPSAARKAAGLPPRPKEKKPQFNERCATEGSSRAAPPPPPPPVAVPVPVIVEEIPEGRQRGKLVYLKEGKFGFIRPRDAKSKDDHAFFNMNELCVFTASPQTPSPRPRLSAAGRRTSS